MNYNYLRYFSVLAQVEHYTLAAARLGISQPSLSSAIHHLEDELGGVKLFEKTGRNIRLTEEGRYFQEKVDNALRELNNASMTLRDSGASAPVIIRLGVVSGTLHGAVAKSIADTMGHNPRIHFHITESSAEELMDLVRQEKLDMAIVNATTGTGASISAAWACAAAGWPCPMGILCARNPSWFPSRSPRSPRSPFSMR